MNTEHSWFDDDYDDQIEDFFTSHSHNVDTDDGLDWVDDLDLFDIDGEL